MIPRRRRRRYLYVCCGNVFAKTNCQLVALVSRLNFRLSAPLASFSFSSSSSKICLLYRFVQFTVLRFGVRYEIAI